MSHRNFEKNEKIWDLVTGCTKVSIACDSCPPLIEAEAKGENFNVQVWEHKLREPLKVIAPTQYHVCFGSDLFLDHVSTQLIIDAFKIMKEAERHTFFVITKRVDRLMYLSDQIEISDNVAIGISVNTKSDVPKIEAIRNLKCKFKYVSAAPLLEPLGPMNLEGINEFGIVEESWGQCRKLEEDWVTDIEKQCKEQGVEFTFQAGVLA